MKVRSEKTLASRGGPGRLVDGAFWRLCPLAILLACGTYAPLANAEVVGVAKVKGAATSPASAPPAPVKQAEAPKTTSTTSVVDQALSPTAFVMLAANISRKVASGEASALYDDVSPIMKTALTRDEFVRQLNTNLSGTVTERDWQDIRQFIVPPSTDKGAAKPGRYVSVRLIVVTAPAGAQSGAARSETLSFHLEPDGSWRLAGFSIAALPAVGAGSPVSSQQR